MNIQQIKDKIYDISGRINPVRLYRRIDEKFHVSGYIRLAIDKRLYATYFPFIGWLIPFLLHKDDKSAMHHGKQSYMLSIFFAVLLISVYFFTYFVPVKFKIMKLLLIILIYIAELLYLAAAIIGTRWVIAGRDADFPLIKKYAYLFSI